MNVTGTFQIDAIDTPESDSDAITEKYGLDGMLHYDCIVRMGIEKFLEKLGYKDVKVDIEMD